jgi:hypothetical protein
MRRNVAPKTATLEAPQRRRLLGALGLGAFLLALPSVALAQEHEAGGSGGGGSGHRGGESGGGHGGEGGESGGGAGQGRTSGERAVRHRQRTGRTLGGGESGGGHTGGGGHGGSGHGGGETGGETGGEIGETTSPTGTIPLPSDGSITGPIGGSVGGEHFVHEGPGNWGADSKVLRRP